MKILLLLVICSSIIHTPSITCSINFWEAFKKAGMSSSGSPGEDLASRSSPGPQFIRVYCTVKCHNKHWTRTPHHYHWLIIINRHEIGRHLVHSRHSITLFSVWIYSHSILSPPVFSTVLSNIYKYPNIPFLWKLGSIQAVCQWVSQLPGVTST